MGSPKPPHEWETSTGADISFDTFMEQAKGIARLKAELEQSRQREARAWAMLARVKDATARFKTSRESRMVPGFTAILDTILADVPGVLAVNNTVAFVDKDGNLWGENQAEIKTKVIDVTEIVLRRDGDNGSGE